MPVTSFCRRITDEVGAVQQVRDGTFGQLYTLRIAGQDMTHGPIPHLQEHLWYQIILGPITEVPDELISLLHLVRLVDVVVVETHPKLLSPLFQRLHCSWMAMRAPRSLHHMYGSYLRQDMFLLWLSLRIEAWAPI